MSEDNHLTARDLTRLRQALESAQTDEAPAPPDAANALDTPEAEARLERLWHTFVSAAAAAAAERSEESAMSNENVPMKRDVVPGLAYNEMPGAWSEAAQSTNQGLDDLLDTILRDLASDRRTAAEGRSSETVERITLADGRVVTRTRTPEK